MTEEAYKAKMAEKRRQAREKAEKEAEEERMRQEAERLAEERRQQEEEEEQRKLEEETIRLAEEARKAEQERLEKAIEAEEKRRKEEAERLEQERKDKEEADRKAKEEAERVEKEKQEKARKDEEERLERKKKLEMIMKRVKTDPSTTDSSSSLKTESPTKSSGSSPNRSALASPEVQEAPLSFAAAAPGQPEDTASPPTESSEGDDDKDAASEEQSFKADTEQKWEAEEPAMTPVVRSASSGDILDASSSAQDEEKELERGDSLGSLNTPSKPLHASISNGTPTSTNTTPATESPSNTGSEFKSRFKSPLLQQLVENKGSGSDASPKFKSPLLQNLLGKTKVGARMGLSASMGDLSLNKSGAGNDATSSLAPATSSKEISKACTDDEDKDQDESSTSSVPSSSDNISSQQSFTAPHMTNGSRRSSDGEEDREVSSDAATSVYSKSLAESSPMTMVDSALGASIEPEREGSAHFGLSNGTVIGEDAHTMNDSSIGVDYKEEKPATVLSGQSSSQEDSEEEEVKETAAEKETIPGGDNGQFEDYIHLLDTSSTSVKAGVSLTGGSPIIAFEDNSLRTADLGESYS